MSDNWQSRPSRSSCQPAVLVVLVLAGLAGAFVWLERDRSHKQIEESMHVHRGDEGALDLVRFETDVVTERHWEQLRPAARSLRTLHLSHTTSVAGGLAAVGEFPNLETLFLIDCQWVDDDQLKQLSGLKLKHSNLTRTAVTDRGLGSVDLSRMQILDLTGCPGITDAGIDRLHEGESLTNVLLEGTSITLDGFERLRAALPKAQLHLARATLLRTFCELDDGSPWLENRQQVDSLLRVFALPHIWHAGTYSPSGDAHFLFLKGPAVGAAMADILTAMPNSDTVMLSQTSIPGGFDAASDAVRRITLTALTGEVNLSSLAAVKSLESLEIYSTEIPEGGLSVLDELPQLKRLYLGACEVSKADLQSVARCESLESLGIASAAIPEGALTSLPELPRLKSLDLYTCEISEADLQSVAQCMSLESLGITSTVIPEGALISLSELLRLKSLGLYRLQVSEADLLDVARCESLERIDLREVAVPDKAGLAIAKLPNLQTLWLTAAKVSPELPEKIQSQSPQLQLHSE